MWSSGELIIESSALSGRVLVQWTELVNWVGFARGLLNEQIGSIIYSPMAAFYMPNGCTSPTPCIIRRCLNT
jgi:hypothetical protein